MSKNLKFVVLGGDKRMRFLAEQLYQEGFEVSDLASAKEIETFLSQTEDIDVIIGPVPLTKDGKSLFCNGTIEIPLTSIGSLVIDNRHFFAGNISPFLCKQIEKQGSFFHDFMKIDTVALENAVATAEGTIAEAIAMSEKNLHKSKCLVLGYGKCAKALAQGLKCLGANVTVAARRQEQRLQAGVAGLGMLNLEAVADNCDRFDFIFNTIPAMILEEKAIKNMKSDAIIIDIASKPGGTDFACCEQQGIQAKLLLGLPGKYSPKSSAEILVRAIRRELLL